MMAKNNKRVLFLLWCMVALLSFNAVFCWISISKLDSKNLQNKIETVETQINTKCDNIKTGLDEIKNNLVTVTDSQAKTDFTLSQTINKLNAKLGMLETTYKELKNEVEKKNGESAINNVFSQLSWWQWTIISGLIILILLPYVVLFFVAKKLPDSSFQTETNNRNFGKISEKIREYIIQVVLDSKRIKLRFTPSPDKDKKKGDEDKKPKDVEPIVDRKIDKIEREVEEKEEKEEKEESIPELANVQYLMGFARDINGFNKVVPTQQDDTFFKIFDIKEDPATKELTAQFDLCVDVQRASENNIFEYPAICLKVKEGDAASGNLKYNRDKDKWEVIMPAKIEFL